MTKSSMSPALPLASAAARPISAEQAIAAQRAERHAAIRIDCPPGGEDEEVVVCGRAGGGSQGYRVPYMPVPGRVARLPGEPPSAAFACARSR